MGTVMRLEAFENVHTISDFGVLPLKSIQQSSVIPGAIHLAFLTVLAAAVVLPQIGVAAYALQSPDIRQAIMAKPLVACELAIALAFWIALFAWPLKALVQRLAWRRSIEISSDTVSIADDRTFASGVWSAPLHTYKGVAHHIRASLSGNRHELVLVHPDADRSVLLMTADSISDTDIARMARLLGMPQVAAKELYAWSSTTDGAYDEGSWQPALA